MTEKLEVSSRARQDPDVLKKMDGGLRRLVRMTDRQILKALKAHEVRRKEAQEKFDRLGRALPPQATTEDREAVERLKRLYRRQLLPHSIWDLVAVDRLRPLRIRTRAIVQFNGNRDDLVSLGLEVRSQAHDIFTVKGTLDELAELAAQPATQRVRHPRLLLPVVEDSAAQAEVDTARLPDAAHPAGLEGQGVIVGIIDGPLDITHRGFREVAPPNNSRVLYYWVHTPDSAAAPGDEPDAYHNANPGTTPDFANPTPLGYGRVYDQAYINNALGLVGGPYGDTAGRISKLPDQEEHGTHVAGIAAGNGRGAGGAAGTHIGAAPQADIIHVCYWHEAAGVSYDATFEDCVIDALDFIFRAADFHNQPAVVNVSQGTNLGPHNGTTPFDQARDNMLNSFTGRSIVFAAGNDDNDNGFKEGTVAATLTETLNMTITPIVDGWGVEWPIDRWLEIWYSGPELEFRVESGPDQSPWRAVGDEYDGNLNGYHVIVDRDSETSPGMRNLRIQIEGALSAAAWTIRLRNPDLAADVQYHAWTCPQGQHATLAGATRNRLTVGDPACAQSILTVGAAAKRHPPNPAQGEIITDYSGAGPTLDGRIKPEIVAVGGSAGDDVQSANSNQASGYCGKRGTSMSAPLASGAIALLFQGLGDDLDQDTLKALLIATANTDDLDPADPGYVAANAEKYGYGRMRLLAAADHTAPLRDIDVWVRTAGDDYGLEPFPGDCFCCAPDIRVFDNLGNETTQITWGDTYTVEVTARNLGFLAATNTQVRLKYTRPWAAPGDWKDAAPAQVRDIPALGFTDPPLQFTWIPDKATVGATEEETHFCLLAEVERLPEDPLTYTPGDPWSTNIKGHNNVALRNVHIQ